MSQGPVLLNLNQSKSRGIIIIDPKSNGNRELKAQLFPTLESTKSVNLDESGISTVKTTSCFKNDFETYNSHSQIRDPTYSTLTERYST